MSSTPPEHDDRSQLHIPVVEEQLIFGTRLVDTGRGVRIHKSVSEHPVAIDERLLREAIEVRHVPIERVVGADEAPGPRYEGDTLIIPVLEEVLVVERKLRIKEELHIIRTRSEERFTDTVTLKAQRVEVERFDETGNPDS